MRLLLCGLAVLLAAISAGWAETVGPAAGVTDAAGAAARPWMGPFDATVLAFRTSMVNARVVANISDIAVEEGQEVARGALLAQLDDAVARAQYELARLQADNPAALKSAQYQLDEARREYEVQLRLHTDNTASLEELARARHKQDLADAQHESVRHMLEQLALTALLRKASLDEYRVLAPFEGIVSAKMVEIGETTYPADKPLFQVVDISRVYARFALDISLLGSVAVGQEAAVTCELHPGKVFAGKVALISPSAATGGRHFVVKVAVDNPGWRLRPEMKARVTLLAPGGDSAEAADDGAAESGGEAR